MHVDQKLNILRHVESSGLPVRKALARLDVPVSTYYRWRRNFHRFGVEGLSDKSTSKGIRMESFVARGTRDHS
jgi:transposase-like protein